ncbi:MAG: hypothetical protein ACLFMM_00765 [Methanohalobium sp.]|uniref:hypothetical protein n=1 Tax=Methanohalobium sp. TaxID=2837493 RepID=UPI00397E5DCF
MYKITKTGISVLFVILLLVSILITLYTSDTKFQFDNNPPDNNHLINNIKDITNNNYSTGIQGDASSTLRLLDPLSILLILVMAFLLLKAIEHI